MREDTVVRNYAETLFELAERHEGAESYGEAAAQMASAMADPRALDFFATPRVSADAKKAVIRSALGSSAPPMLVRFLHVVINKGRQRLIPSILEGFQRLLDRHRGVRHMAVTVAHPVDGTEREDLAAQLSSATNSTVVPTVRVKPEIIGGIVIREGDTLYDGSMKRQIDVMRRRLMAVELQEQEG